MKTNETIFQHPGLTIGVISSRSLLFSGSGSNMGPATGPKDPDELISSGGRERGSP